MAASTKRLEDLRQAVLGNGRGREVEVEPTGEIRETGGNNGNGSHEPQDRPSKASKMSPHTFGA